MECGKKRRHPIGSMLDVEVNNNGSEQDDAETSFGSSSDGGDSLNSDTSDGGSDGEHNEAQNNDSHANDKEIVARGPAKLVSEWGTGMVMLLQLDEENNVVGTNSGAFSSQLGIFAKDGNKLPLFYTDWRVVPKSQKDLVWEEVKDNTNLTESYRRNCMKKLGKSWKDWKNRLKKKYYTPHKHDKKYVLSKCPERVEANQWPILVNYWSSKKAKKISKSNKKSRKEVNLTPRLGRKDLPNARYEYRKETGKVPSKLALFIYSRQKRTTKPLDPITAEKIALLKEMKEKLPEHLRDDIVANDEIFETVVGKDAPGCLRGSGATSKGNKLAFTSREEFERSVQEKSTQEVTNIRKKFEDEMLKFRSECNTEMEMLRDRVITLENHRTPHVLGSSNTRRIQGPKNLETSDNHSNETLEVTKELSNLDENNSNAHFDAGTQQPKDQGKNARRKSQRNLGKGI